MSQELGATSGPRELIHVLRISAYMIRQVMTPMSRVFCILSTQAAFCFLRLLISASCSVPGISTQSQVFLSVQDLTFIIQYYGCTSASVWMTASVNLETDYYCQRRDHQAWTASGPSFVV